MRRKRKLEDAFIDIDLIVDMPVPAFELHSVAKRSSLLRWAANALDAAQPATAENLRMSHLLANWANELDASIPSDAVCECGNLRRECVCDQQAAEHFLATGDGSRLLGLGWHRDVLEALEVRDIVPGALQTSAERNFYQKSATPIQIRCQAMW